MSGPAGPVPEAPRAPRVSVAVSTYRRAGSLARLVRALEKQTLPYEDFEVVIADDGSADGTGAALEELRRSSPLQLTVLHSDVNRGAAAGRNRAWRAGRAPVVAFTDDDCSPQPEWLEAGLDAMAGASVVVGRTVPPPEQEPLTDGPFARVLRVSEPKFFETANIFYRRADLERVDGFDETFLKSGEDTDLAMRLVPSSTVAFASDALVYHDVRPSDFLAAVRECRKWVDLPRVVKLHPEVRRTLLHRRVFWKDTHPPALLALVGIVLAATRRAPLALVLTAPWVRLRVLKAPLTFGPRRRWLVLPPGLALDLVEVGVMVQGSVRHHTLVL